MSDFDFEEIDKAVAGVLGPDDSGNASPQSQPAQPEQSTQPAPRPFERPEAVPARQEQVTVTERPQPTAPVPAPAARRSAGRFMDVVHPSSDMRTRNTPAFIPPVVQEKTEPEVTNSGIELEDDLLSGDWSKPLESPFLPDAKVEKRPLGAFTAAGTEFNPEELLEAPDEELKLEEPDDPRIEATMLPDPIDFAAQFANVEPTPEVQPQPEVVEQPVPAAFDLNAEMLQEEPEIIENHEEKSASAETIPLEEIVQPVAELEQPERPAAPVSEPEQESVGPTSISQQYVEQPVSQQVSGAIYDTENYHQPVTAAPKKRSGIWPIVWIILLVVLGAGAGVAFYLFVLPML